MLPLARLALVGATALLLAPGLTAAGQTGSITGRITARSTGEPLADVNVEAVSGGVTAAHTLSRSDGSFTLSGLSAGSYTVRARRVGFEFSQVEGVVVQAGGTATLDLSTVPLPPQLEQVVTTATRGSESEKILDSPNSISVVPQVQIAERAAATVTDHIKAVPGLSVSTGGIAQANIVSRGFNNAFSGSMLMLQDYRFAGVPSLRVNVPFLFTGSNEDIERIEVLQGPAAALYGPNSGNGVLHIITQSPFHSRGTTLTVAGGEQSLGRFSGRHAGVGLDGKLGYKLSGEYFTARDFVYRDPNEPAAYSATDERVPESRRGQPVDRDFDLRKTTGEARIDYRPSPNTEFITTVGHSRLGSAIELTTVFGSAQAKNWTYTNVQQRFRHNQTFAQIFYNTSDAGNSSATDDAGTFYLRSGIPIVDRSHVLAGQVQQGLNVARTKVVVGGEYIATRPKTEGTIHGRNEDDDSIDEFGAYIQTTTPILPRLDLLAAVRGDQNTRLEGTQLSPRAAVIFRPTQTQNVRVTFNRAFNSPQAFSFFLDQYFGISPVPGMPFQVIGNPPKEGWTFARGCEGGVQNGVCMRSPFMPGLIPASASAAYPGFIQALPTLIAAAPVTMFPGGEGDRQALLGLLNHPQLGPIIRSLTPTEADVSSNVLDLSTDPVGPWGEITDYRQLRAAFSNTWEVGYKGILGNRVRLAADFWYQRRPAEPTTALINPALLFNGPALGSYLGTQVAARLIAAGADPATAAQQGQTVAAALTPVMAQVPIGTAAFTNSLYDQPFLVLSYRPATGHIWVNGLDLAADFVLTDRLMLATTYSNLSRNLFPNAPGSSPARPMAANTPKHRATATFRYENDVRGYSAEVRGRYADAFQVNSGVMNSFNISTPVPYEPVPVFAVLDLNSSMTLPFARGPRLSITANNILNNKVRTFVGVPNLGRLIITQLQYTF